MIKRTKSLSDLTVHKAKHVDIWLGVLFFMIKEKDMSEQVELLVFNLGEKEYAVDTSSVHEVRSFEGVTKVRDCPNFLLGVINLRGVIIPIIDLRIKFITPNPNPDQFVSVIILNTKTREMGLVVDSVSDVISVLGPIGPREVVGASGTYSVEGRILHLLDIDALDES